MALVITAESELGKEMAKWEKPWVYTEYPRCLYMAQRRPDGRMSVAEVNDALFGGQPGAAEAFTKTCQRTVRNEAEHINAKNEGWRNTQPEAIERYESKEKAIADVAAHRHYEDRNMGEKAQLEAAEADASTMEHVAEVPRKRMGRPRKNPLPTA